MVTQRWIVGLGNPGRRYERTRHNVGFRVVDLLASEHGTDLDRRKFQAVYGQGRHLAASASEPAVSEDAKLYLVKPQAYMNASGPPVRDLMRYFREETTEDLANRLLVVHDDIDLEEGRLRFRARGSAGGHRGVQSVISALGHGNFARLKIGVGRRQRGDAARYVLEKVDESASGLFDETVERAARAAGVWLEAGMRESMNRFNAGPGKPRSSDSSGSTGPTDEADRR